MKIALYLSHACVYHLLKELKKYIFNILTYFIWVVYVY